MRLWAKDTREPVPMEVRFVPQPDITVYELAVILSKTMKQPVIIPWDVWPTIDSSIQRHLK